jgi:hypothetical protein
MPEAIATGISNSEVRLRLGRVEGILVGGKNTVGKTETVTMVKVLPTIRARKKNNFIQP